MISLQKSWFLFVAALFLLAMGRGTTTDNLDIEISAEQKVDSPNKFVVEWLVKGGSVVPLEDFKLKRQMSGSTRYPANIRQDGPFLFRCEDELFKGSSDETASENNVVYTLYVNGAEVATTETSYTTNAVRRTWGNIKSMFQ